MRAVKWILLIALIVLAARGQAAAGEEIQVRTPGVSSRIAVEPAANPRQAIVAVLDPSGEPIHGLQAHDFTLARGIRKARVVAVEPLQASKATPVNLAMVIDNSFSMQARGAIGALLEALEGLLKDVRPIDNVHAHVFSDRAQKTAGGRSLNVRAFHTGQGPEWNRFFGEVFAREITSKTYLYDAIMAGLDTVRTMPADEKKLLMVFSDGEDLNSVTGRSEVAAAARGIKNLQIFCIDYMPEEKTDPFLTSLANDHHGRIWKARSAQELVPIFQDFKSTILHRYVLTIRCPVGFARPSLLVGGGSASESRISSRSLSVDESSSCLANGTVSDGVYSVATKHGCRSPTLKAGSSVSDGHHLPRVPQAV